VGSGACRSGAVVRASGAFGTRLCGLSPSFVREAEVSERFRCAIRLCPGRARLRQMCCAIGLGYGVGCSIRWLSVGLVLWLGSLVLWAGLLTGGAGSVALFMLLVFRACSCSLLFGLCRVCRRPARAGELSGCPAVAGSGRSTMCAL
jgi:hypothetical protein